MRELKFRVYIPDRKVLEYFELGKFYYSDSYLFQHKYPVQQFTGLNDSKGVPIYEGDIVKVFNSWERSDIGVVSYDEPYGAFRVVFSDIFTKTFYQCGNSEVIGNINENPELINQNS